MRPNWDTKARVASAKRRVTDTITGQDVAKLYDAVKAYAFH